MIEQLNSVNKKYLLDMVEFIKNETGEIIDIKADKYKSKTAFLYADKGKYLGFLICSARQLTLNGLQQNVGLNEGIFLIDKNPNIARALIKSFEEWARNNGCDVAISGTISQCGKNYSHVVYADYDQAGVAYVKRLNKMETTFER